MSERILLLDYYLEQESLNMFRNYPRYRNITHLFFSSGLADAHSQNDVQSERGFSIIEILVSLLIAGVMSMGIVRSVSTALQTSKITEFNHIANSLASTKIEELATIPVPDLDSSFNATETNVSWPHFGCSFTRQTTVVVNADESRSVTVNVTSNSDYAPTNLELKTIFSKWK